MDKAMYKSKTIIGTAVVVLVSLGTTLGIVDAGTVTNVLSTLGVGTIVWGIRDALN